MSEHRLISTIRENPRWRRLFSRLNKTERRQLLYIADGETDHLDEIFEFVLEGRKQR